MSAERTVSTGLIPPVESVTGTGEAAQPVFKKTPLMRRIEERCAKPGEPIDEFLHRLYVDKSQSLTAIAQAFRESDCSVNYTTIGRWLENFFPKIQIRRRQMSQRIRKSRVSNPDMYRRLREDRRRRFEENVARSFGKDPREFVTRMVVGENLSVPEIATRIGQSTYFVRRVVREYKVEPKPRRRRLIHNEFEERRKMIRQANDDGLLERLTPEQRKVLLARYPEEGIVPTQIEVARGLHLTFRQQVWQCERDGLADIERLLALDSNRTTNL